MAKVMVAMSGGVDSSVAAGLLVEQGHEVVGATLKLWGGTSDSGCCSVSDVEDARRVATQIGIKHFVFNFTEEFEAKVVDPYVTSHSRGETPNPCAECNRHIKFDLLLERAVRLGFDYLATGHYARVVDHRGKIHLARGVDRAKDQSYVLSMLKSWQIKRLMLPVGEYPKTQVREIARGFGFRNADKGDSLEVCFITKTQGRVNFLGERIPLRRAKVVDASTRNELDMDLIFETVTVGQRKGVGTLGDAKRHYVIDKDATSATVVLGVERDLYVRSQRIHNAVFASGEAGPSPEHEILVQGAAHGSAVPAYLDGETLRYRQPRRRVAPGQLLAFYDDDVVLGSALVKE
jgi:tRNA-specific 2-thiouridylase